MYAKKAEHEQEHELNTLTSSYVDCNELLTTQGKHTF
jgi:hypothetical protein